MKRIILIAIIMLFIILLSCDSNPVSPIKIGEPPILEGDLVFGEIYVRLEPHINLKSFIKTYSKVGLNIESTGLNKNYIMSFNYNLIEGNELVKMIEDRGDGWAELLPGWVRGELIFGLSQTLSEGEVDEIINYYQNKGLVLLSQSKSLSYFRFSFNYRDMKEFEIRNYLRNDNRLLSVDFNGPDRLWKSGIIMLFLLDDDFESFLSSYSEYDFNVRLEWKELKYLSLGFDYEQYDEFYIVDMLNNDPRVVSVLFSTHIPFAEGF